MIQCPKCKWNNNDAAVRCANCAADLRPPQSPPQQPQRPQAPQPPPPACGGQQYPPPQQGYQQYPPGAFRGGEPKSRVAAGLMGILLGYLGIHRFYLGYVAIGIIQLLLGLLGFFTCGLTSAAAWLWGLIEGICILTGAISQDARGIPLKE